MLKKHQAMYIAYHAMLAKTAWAERKPDGSVATAVDDEEEDVEIAGSDLMDVVIEHPNLSQAWYANAKVRNIINFG